MTRIQFFLLLISFFFIGISWSAQEPSVDELVAMEERPSMALSQGALKEHRFEQGIPVSQQWVLENGYDERILIPEWTQILLNYAPQLIATLEKAYPGGRYVFIGRDGSAIADVIEAFYLSLGQKNRVARIGVSKKSFSNLNIEILMNILGQIDYSLESWKSSPPLIFVDPVSRGNGRQGRHLLALLYDEILNNRNEMKEKEKIKSYMKLIGKINLLGLIVSTHPGDYFSFNDPEAYFAKARDLAERGVLNSFDYLYKYHPFMSIPRAKQEANESGYTHYIGSWHESYGRFEMDREGKAHATLGRGSHPNLKKSVLWTQQQIWQAVETSQFRERVASEAEELGYKFPLKSCGQKLMRGL